MWARIAEEMAIPWRAAEAMHWQMGEVDMARRAGVTPFSFNAHPPAPSAQVAGHPARPHVRTATAAPAGARSGYNTPVGPMSHQLPSLAEITTGLPAYATLPAPTYHPRPTPSDLYRHVTTTGPGK